MGIIEIITTPFAWVLRTFYELTGSYAFGLLVFALFVKVVLIPFGIKQQKTQIKSARLRPQMMAIEKKYAGRNDQKTKQKKQQELMDLQQREGVSMFGGCLPLLIQLPIIMILYGIVREPLTYICQFSAETITALTEKAIEVLGSEATSLSQLEVIGAIQTHGAEAFASVGADLSLLPDFHLFGVIDLSVTPSSNFLSWLLVIPLANLVLSFFSMKITRKLNPPMQMNTGAQGEKASNTIMDLIMPVMSFYFAFILNAAVGLYWLYNSLFSILQSIVLAKVMPLPTFTKEDLEKAEKQVKVEEAQREPKELPRSLHHIDDDDEELTDEFIASLSSRYDREDEETPNAAAGSAANAAPSKTAEASVPVEKAPLKDDSDKKTKEKK